MIGRIRVRIGDLTSNVGAARCREFMGESIAQEVHDPDRPLSTSLAVRRELYRTGCFGPYCVYSTWEIRASGRPLVARIERFPDLDRVKQFYPGLVRTCDALPTPGRTVAAPGGGAEATTRATAPLATSAHLKTSPPPTVISRLKMRGSLSDGTVGLVQIGRSFHCSHRALQSGPPGVRACRAEPSR